MQTQYHKSSFIPTCPTERKKKATNIGKAKLWFKPLPQVGISVTLPLALISYINGCNQKNTSENKAYAVSETLEQNNLCLLLVFLLREKKNYQNFLYLTVLFAAGAEV